jgi:hypothetical protein
MLCEIGLRYASLDNPTNHAISPRKRHILTICAAIFDYLRYASRDIYKIQSR